MKCDRMPFGKFCAKNSPNSAMSFNLHTKIMNKCEKGCITSLSEYSAQSTGRGVEQLVARRAHNPKVVGSNPAPATN